jgi:hypothetical protein
MDVRVIPRSALTGYLKLVRVPLDTAIGLLPGNGRGLKPAAQLALDRADAGARSIAGTLFGDPVLREDGARRRKAASERERGLRLRDQAEQTAEVADARLEKREQQAHQQRQRARASASAKRRQAETQAQNRKERAAKAEIRSRDASRRAAAQRAEAIEERAPREELAALQAKTEALRAREDELTARDEAHRLAEAASELKEQRKSGE